MLHHYLTKYKDEEGNQVYVSWLQVFNFTFSKRYYVNGKKVKG